MFKGSVKMPETVLFKVYHEWTDCKREVRDKMEKKRRDLFINENKGTD